jgi:hypothetical protein
MMAEVLKRKVNFWIEDTSLKEKIDHITTNIQNENDGDMDCQMISEKLKVHLRGKKFDLENFAGQDILKRFANENL